MCVEWMHKGMNERMHAELWKLRKLVMMVTAVNLCRRLDERLKDFSIKSGDLRRNNFRSIKTKAIYSSHSSVHFSCSVVSDSLQPHEPQHARPPCPSPTPGVYSNSCPLIQWCQATISSSVIPISSCHQCFPASGSFQMSPFFASRGQSTGVSASVSVLPVNIQDWFPLRWTGWISLQSKGLSRVFSNTTVQKHQFFSAQLSLQSNSHIHTWLLGKP